MIQTKSDLRAYIRADYKAYGRAYPVTVKERLRDWRIRDTNLRFMVNLRCLEYWWNRTEVSSGISKLLAKIVRAVYVRRYERLRAVTGIDIWINSVGPGLHVVHGKSLVNPLAKLGSGCKINSDVTIGAQGRYDVPGAPFIGDRVYIGTGARVLGGIKVADDVVIGANAVVTKDIAEPGITVAGIPAKKISNCGSYHYLNR